MTQYFLFWGDLKKLMEMVTIEMCKLKWWFDRNKLLNLNKNKFMLIIGMNEYSIICICICKPYELSVSVLGMGGA